MPPSLPPSKINALGRRLAESNAPSAGDLELLAEVQSEYVRPLELTGEILRERLNLGAHGTFRGVELTASNRLKTIGPIIDKLRRKTRLSTMQDIVGFRIVGSLSLTEQDSLVKELCEAFPNARVVDRRSRPMYGYRAVHVIAPVDGFPVEIQVRTVFQDIWAQLMERLGDTVGREIRYGELPPGLDERARASVAEKVQRLKELGDELYTHDDLLDGLQAAEKRLELQRQQQTEHKTRRLRLAVERGESETRRLSRELDRSEARVKLALRRFHGDGA